jgi:hypothetical protein
MCYRGPRKCSVIRSRRPVLRAYFMTYHRIFNKNKMTNAFLSGATEFTLVSSGVRVAASSVLEIQQCIYTSNENVDIKFSAHDAFLE